MDCEAQFYFVLVDSNKVQLFILGFNPLPSFFVFNHFCVQHKELAPDLLLDFLVVYDQEICCTSWSVTKCPSREIGI